MGARDHIHDEDEQSSNQPAKDMRRHGLSEPPERCCSKERAKVPTCVAGPGTDPPASAPAVVFMMKTTYLLRLSTPILLVVPKLSLRTFPDCDGFTGTEPMWPVAFTTTQ